MIDLDDPQIYDQLDPSRMRVRLKQMGDNCLKGWDNRPVPDLPSKYADSNRIVVCGIGGSAMAGDYLKWVVAKAGGPSVEVYRDFDFGGIADDRTLIVASSYSGNTEETISSFDEFTSGNKLVLTSGGRLEELASEMGVPIYTIDIISEPRAAFGFGLFSLLSCVNQLKLIPDCSDDVNEAIEVMNQSVMDCSELVPVESNQAKTLAWQLFENLIVVYGSEVFSAVARRWKTQLNENGKSWAFYEILPEAVHNAVEGFERPGTITDRTHLILMSSASLDERLSIRYDAITNLANKAGVGFSSISAEGETPLAQMMHLTVLGDYVSYYLGILYGSDPSPIPRINALKAIVEEGL